MPPLLWWRESPGRTAEPDSRDSTGAKDAAGDFAPGGDGWPLGFLTR